MLIIGLCLSRLFFIIEFLCYFRGLYRCTRSSKWGDRLPAVPVESLESDGETDKTKVTEDHSEHPGDKDTASSGDSSTTNADVRIANVC